MKTTLHLKKLVLFLFIISSSSLFSQPLSGNYTIGGVGPDYLSFTAAVGAIQNNGVSGPVIFNVRNGFYNEKISIYQFLGSSVTNTVTFQSEDGDSSLVILSDSSSTLTANNFTLQIFGADNIIFRQITIQRPGTLANGRVIEIGFNSNNISLINNRILAGSATAATIAKCLVYSDSLNQNNDIVISGNLMVNGNYGVYKLASQLETGNIISNNIFQNQYVGSVYVDKQNGITISGNEITVAGSANYRAITISRSVNGCSVEKNKISVTTGNAGLYYLNCSPLAGFENTASNNFIHVAGTTVNSGILLSNSKNLNFFHNSVNMTGTSATSNAFFSSGSGISGINLKNNIFCHSGTGYAIRVTDTVALAVSDYNAFYTKGTNIGSYNLVNALVLSDWQTLSSKDSNSISANPAFTSITDLHSISVSINNQGTPIASVTTDIDGEARSITSPDIGADEFTPMSNNVSFNSIASPFVYSCGDSNTVITIVIQNMGMDTASSIPVTIEISGTQSLVINDTVPGPLGPYESDTLTIAGVWNTYQGGIFTLTCYTSLPGDEYLFNDTLSKSITVIAIPDTPSVVSPQIFCENNVNITALTDSGNVIFWYDQPAGGNLLFSGNPFSPSISGDTMFYAEAHSGIGSTGCLRITEINLNTPDYIEIQNCSAGPVDVTGWVIAISNNYTNINQINPILWDLSSFGTMAPGQIEYKTDGTTNNYWGNNMLWNPGATTPGWAIIIDNTGIVVDFAAYGWSDANLQLFAPVINSFQIALGSNWSASSINPACSGTDALSRVGNSDNDDANDFICTAGTLGTQNAALVLPFASCGASACGSSRVPVTVQINPAPVVDLGPDTISALPVTFDAGSGFSAYLWNTSATTQTINVSTTGTYSVVVTDGNGCTATDSVKYTSTVGIYWITSINNVSIWPNPAQEQINVTLNSSLPQDIEFQLYNCIGEILFLEKRKLQPGNQNLVFKTGEFPPGIYNLTIQYQDGLINKKCILH